MGQLPLRRQGRVVISPGQLAARDQSDAAVREVHRDLARRATATGRAAHYEPPAFRAWVDDLLAATRPVACGHVSGSPRALTALLLRRGILYVGCRLCLAALRRASPPVTWACDRCLRLQLPRHPPVEAALALGPVALRVQVCDGCALNLDLDDNPRPIGRQQEGSTP